MTLAEFLEHCTQAVAMAIAHRVGPSEFAMVMVAGDLNEAIAARAEVFHVVDDERRVWGFRLQELRALLEDFEKATVSA